MKTLNTSILSLQLVSKSIQNRELNETSLIGVSVTLNLLKDSFIKCRQLILDNKIDQSSLNLMISSFHSALIFVLEFIMNFEELNGEFNLLLFVSESLDDMLNVEVIV